MQPLPSPRGSGPADALPVRDLAEMRVAEQLVAGDCPLCGTRAIAERRLVDALIGEAVNDVGVRRRLDAGGGFCARHTAMLPIRERARRGGTLGSAILLGSVLRARLAGLEAAVARVDRRTPARLVALRTAACPICADVDTSLAGFLTVVIARLADARWAGALAQTPMCFDDLVVLWAAVASSGGRSVEAFRPVGEAQAARLYAILATADGYIAHSGHDRAAALTDDERVAADALAVTLAGEIERC